MLLLHIKKPWKTKTRYCEVATGNPLYLSFYQLLKEIRPVALDFVFSDKVASPGAFAAPTILGPEVIICSYHRSFLRSQGVENC